MPRVLFIGDVNAYSKGLVRLECMRRLGAELSVLRHTPLGGDDAGHPPLSLAFRIAWKLGVHLDTEGADAKLAAEAERFRPDLVWIEKGNMIRPRSLAALRAARPTLRIAAYSDDDMAQAHNATRAFRRGLPFYDVVFTTKAHNIEPDGLPAQGARRVVVVDKAYDPAAHFPMAVGETGRAALGAEVGFIGTFEEPRARAMLTLAEAGIAVRIWGNGWQSWAGRHPLLRVEGRALVNTAAELTYTKGICATGINLCFLRKINRDTHTDRSVEIPACGAFMLAERTLDHQRLFHEGEEAEFFDGDDELLAKVRRYLGDAAARAGIGAAGRRACVERGYSQEDRVRQMLDSALLPAPTSGATLAP